MRTFEKLKKKDGVNKQIKELLIKQRELLIRQEIKMAKQRELIESLRSKHKEVHS